MKRGAAALAVAVIPGALVVLAIVGGGMFAAMYAAARTGIADLDKLRGAAVRALMRAWPTATPAVARAFVGGVLANEAAYTEGDARYRDAAFPRGRAGYFPVGDVGHALGPAVGPGQVLSGLHLRRLGFTGDPLDLARVELAGQALYYAARVFREAYEATSKAKGRDERIREAIRRYNGSGKAAEAYADKAWERIAGLGGLPT